MKTFVISSKKNDIIGDTKNVRIMTQQESRVAEICQHFINWGYDYKLKNVDRTFEVKELSAKQIEDVLRF